MVIPCLAIAVGSRVAVAEKKCHRLFSAPRILTSCSRNRSTMPIQLMIKVTAKTFTTTKILPLQPLPLILTQGSAVDTRISATMICSGPALYALRSSWMVNMCACFRVGMFFTPIALSSGSLSAMLFAQCARSSLGVLRPRPQPVLNKLPLLPLLLSAWFL